MWQGVATYNIKSIKICMVSNVLQSEDFAVFFGADILLIPGLREVATRFPHIDLALFAVNGLQVHPAFNQQVVMNAHSE